MASDTSVVIKASIGAGFVCVFFFATALFFYFFHVELRPHLRVRRWRPPPPLSARERRKSPIRVMSQDEIELVAPAEPFRAHPGREPAECSVCLEEISTGQCVRTLQCSHCFHVQCIDPWFCTNAICPSCRKDVVPPPPPEPQAAAITLAD